jgi:fermentation-respiration switch protein FrsA (DUF1100 family)
MSFWKKRLPLWLHLLVYLLAALIFGSFGLSRVILHVPRRKLEFPREIFSLIPEKKDVKFLTEDGLTLSGWFIPATIPSEKTIILCHGYGTNRTEIFSRTIFLRWRGYNLLYFDFRAHGESEGKISTFGLLELKDLKAAIDYLKREKASFSKTIIVIGVSLGASVAIVLAAKDKRIQAVIAESPFPSFKKTVLRYARAVYGISFKPLFSLAFLFVRLRLGSSLEINSPFHWIEKISPRPLFLILGENDRYLYLSEGYQLYKKAKEPKELWIIPRAYHRPVLWTFESFYHRKISDFLKQVVEKSFSNSSK